MPQVTSIKTFYASKQTSFFTFLLFSNVLPVAQGEFKQPIKQLQYQFRSQD